ncbi:aminotransferase class I/II-fold pyridoxal phosphate-dependent enzyme [Paenibacillus sp. Z6-24]
MNYKKNEQSAIGDKLFEMGNAGNARNGRAPLYEKLVRYASSGQRSFHVPGHKNGTVYQSADLLEAFGQDLLGPMLRIDVTEIEGTDDLHHPEEVILEGQQLAAECFGAEETYWLVGGSTSGNLALLLTACTHPGDIVIVQRNVHKSIIHGLMMAGAKAVFLAPDMEPGSELAVVPSLQNVREALHNYPGAKAVMLTAPNYYGIGTDLAAIAAECHTHHVPLLVDEAHGAHYNHHPRFPTSALRAGADGVVQSTHKMLAAMTMGAMLHVQGPLINRSLLKQRLTMLQSSSPSYPIMASLDLSRYLLDMYGAELFTKGLQARDHFVEGVAGNSRFGVLEVDSAIYNKKSMNGEAAKNTDADRDGRNLSCWTQDPFKVVIYDRLHHLSGTQLQKLLEQYGCFAEMSDERYVVLVFSLGSRMEDAQQALHALQQIEVKHSISIEEKGIKEESDIKELKTLKALFIDGSAGKVIKELESLKHLKRGTGSHFLNEILANDMIAEQATLNSDISVKQCNTDQPDSDVQSQGIPLISEPIEFTMIPVSEEQIETVILEQARGRESAEMIIPYPPGIPILYPGERIGRQVHEQLLLVRDNHMKVQGAADSSLQSIRVFQRSIQDRIKTQ